MLKQKYIVRDSQNRPIIIQLRPNYIDLTHFTISPYFQVYIDNLHLVILVLILFIITGGIFPGEIGTKVFGLFVLGGFPLLTGVTGYQSKMPDRIVAFLYNLCAKKFVIKIFKDNPPLVFSESAQLNMVSQKDILGIGISGLWKLHNSPVFFESTSLYLFIRNNPILEVGTFETIHKKQKLQLEYLHNMLTYLLDLKFVPNSKDESGLHKLYCQDTYYYCAQREKFSGSNLLPFEEEKHYFLRSQYMKYFGNPRGKIDESAVTLWEIYNSLIFIYGYFLIPLIILRIIDRVTTQYMNVILIKSLITTGNVIIVFYILGYLSLGMIPIFINIIRRDFVQDYNRNPRFYNFQASGLFSNNLRNTIIIQPDKFFSQLDDPQISDSILGFHRLSDELKRKYQKQKEKNSLLNTILFILSLPSIVFLKICYFPIAGIRIIFYRGEKIFNKHNTIIRVLLGSIIVIITFLPALAFFIIDLIFLPVNLVPMLFYLYRTKKIEKNYAQATS